MAIYKTISSKVILRKIFRDIKPNHDNWIDDAIEWIGEALEHIGSSTQLDTKVCVLPISNYKGVLPTDFYYSQMVGVNNAIAPSIETELDELLSQVNDIQAQLASNPNQDLTYQMRELNSRIVVLENIYMSDSSMVTPLAYCTTAFPNAEACPECVNQTTTVKECYFIENDRIKTSFASGKVCISYKAFPVDDDCYPLVPDDISFKEAMFWYVYKKMLLGGDTPVENGINYIFAEQQWKYYCTQARNAANYPDIDRYESFMNQWVRLIPNINRHSAAFENLGTRETLHRGSANTYGL
jgi:hypothetical protein